MVFFEKVDRAIAAINEVLSRVLFFNLWPFDDGHKLPLVLAWLIAAALFCTVALRFINVRGFLHALRIVSGRYSNKDGAGEVTHFQALTTALSATVGLGNIAGVAIAVSVGGPGATFWMVLAGFLGMSSKFAECTLAQIYRTTRDDGRIMGGAMEYLSIGLREIGLPKLGKSLAVVFAVFCMFSSLGGGNSFQVSQSYSSVAATFTWFQAHSWLYGLMLAIAVGVVVLGGIKRIADVASKLVPLMCGLYVALCISVLLLMYDKVPDAFLSIWYGAFTPEAGYGGVIGVMVIGFQRAAFSNEAGLGSSAIAHSAAKTSHPAQEGYVALLEPFVDTVVICTMTALVIVITGAFNNPDYAEIRAASQGAALTVSAFSEFYAWVAPVLAIVIVLFAFSTIVSWFYYGERCFSYLFGEKYSFIFKLSYVLVTFVSASVSAGSVLEFSDLVLLGMAFPNLLGVYLLFGKITAAVKDYRIDRLG